MFDMSLNPLFLLNGAVAFGTTELAFLTLYTATVLLVPSHATVTRLTSVAALFVLTHTLQQTFLQWCSNQHWQGFVAACLPVQLMSASEIILVSRADPAPVSRGIVHAYHTITLLWNQRRVGTIWQVKNIPATTPSTRAQFLRRRLTTTLAAYLVLDAMVSAPPPSPALHTAQKQTLLNIHALSPDDLTFRLTATLSYWLSGFLLLLTVSNTLAIALVLTGLSSPAARPPLFGSIADGYSIRRFWGTLWHQCLRRGLAGHADLLVNSVLRIPRRTLLSRYARLFAAFLLSGLIHRVCERGMGVPSREGGALVFFPLQALGIVAEDGVQAAVGRRCRPGVRRAVGYAWVAVFLAWSSPTWFYPQQRVGRDAATLLPFRLFGPLVQALKSGRVG